MPTADGDGLLTTSVAFGSFSVDDLDAAETFYGRTLGLTVVQEDGLLTLHLPGGDVLAYLKDDHVPATFTILNFPVIEIERTVDELAARGVTFERYDQFDHDERGITRGEQGPAIACSPTRLATSCPSCNHDDPLTWHVTVPVDDLHRRPDDARDGPRGGQS